MLWRLTAVTDCGRGHHVRTSMFKNDSLIKSSGYTRTHRPPPLPPVWLSTHKRKWPNLGRCLIAHFIRDVLWSQPFFFSSYSLIPLISYTLFSMNAPLEQSRQRIATRMRKYCIDEFIRLLHFDLYLNLHVFLERVALSQSQSFHHQLPYRIIYWALLKHHWMQLGSLCWCFVLMYALMELYAWTLN